MRPRGSRSPVRSQGLSYMLTFKLPSSPLTPRPGSYIKLTVPRSFFSYNKFCLRELCNQNPPSPAPSHSPQIILLSSFLQLPRLSQTCMGPGSGHNFRVSADYPINSHFCSKHISSSYTSQGPHIFFTKWLLFGKVYVLLLILSAWKTATSSRFLKNHLYSQTFADYSPSISSPFLSTHTRTRRHTNTRCFLPLCFQRDYPVLHTVLST